MGRSIKKFDSSDELDLAVRYIGEDPETWVASGPTDQMQVIESYRDALGQGKLANTNLIPPDIYLKKELGMDPRDVRTPVELPESKAKTKGLTRITDVKEQRDTSLKGLYEESVPQWIREKKAATTSRLEKTKSPVMRGVYSVGAKALSKLESKYTDTPEYQSKKESILTTADTQMAQIREDRIKDPSNKRMIELLEDIEANTRGGGMGGSGEDYEDDRAPTKRGRKSKLSKMLTAPFAALGGAFVGDLASDKFGAKMVGAGSTLVKMFSTMFRDSKTTNNTEKSTTSSTKVDTTKMSFTERFKSLWEGDPSKSVEGEEGKGDKKGLFASISNLLKGGLSGIFGRLGGLFGKLGTFITPLLGIFSKMAVVLGPILGVLGAAFAGWKAGGFITEQFLTNKDGSNKLADLAMRITGKDKSFTPGSYDDPKAAMDAYNKAKDSGGTVSPQLAEAVEKFSKGAIKVDPKMIRSHVAPAADTNGSKVAQQSAALGVAEQKKEQIKKKNEEQKHQALVDAPRNVQVVAPSIQSNTTTSSSNLSTRNPDSTLQLFLQSRMRYA